MKTLEEYRSKVDRLAQDTLGAWITYTPAGQSARRVKAQIDYGEQLEAFGGVQSRGQNFEIHVLKADVPTISEGDRITGLKVAGMFKPKGSPSNTNEGTGWYIEVERVR